MGVPTTYKAKIICRNCIQTEEIDVPYKTNVFDHIHKKECKNCGLITLIQLRPEGI